jgi:hypothetical protein
VLRNAGVWLDALVYSALDPSASYSTGDVPARSARHGQDGGRARLQRTVQWTLVLIVLTRRRVPMLPASEPLSEGRNPSQSQPRSRRRTDEIMDR